MPLANSPGAWSLDLYAGMTFTTRATPSGTPWDLTGYDARAQFRESYTAGSAVLTLGTAAGSAVITLGGTAGYVQVDITAATTAALGSALGVYSTGQAASLVWDLELVNGADVTQFARGLVQVYPEATR